jgi:hypothetical protein
MRLPLLFALVACALPAFAQGEPIDPRPERAAAILTGAVEDTYQRAKGDECALRFRIEGVEKGHGLRIGSRIYVRLAGKADSLPKAERHRVFLSGSRQDGWTLLPGGAEDATTRATASPRGDTAKLEALIKRLHEAAKVDDWKSFAAVAKELRMPNAEGWFQRVFGETSGKLVAAEYAKIQKSLIVELRRTYQGLLAEGGGPFQVLEATGYRATGLQRRAKFAMQVPVPLYTVRYTRAGIALWSFVYVGRTWRWIGKLQALPREPLVLRVEFGTTRVDTSKLSEYTLRITIRNASEETVRVPTLYDGRMIRLYGRGAGHLWASRLELAQPPRQAFAPLKPKERRTLLELPLDKVFTLKDPSRRWDGEGHPVPPLSPIHRWRNMGHEGAAVFYVAAEAGRRTLHSKPAQFTIVGER